MTCTSYGVCSHLLFSAVMTCALDHTNSHSLKKMTLTLYLGYCLDGNSTLC